MEVDWIKPKTNWASTDRMNLEDYNRIKNNILYLKEKANEVNKEFSIQNMGEDIVDYLELWDYEKFNLFEGNIEKINQSIFTQDIGIKKTFYPNCPVKQGASSSGLGVFVNRNSLPKPITF